MKISIEPVRKMAISGEMARKYGPISFFSSITTDKMKKTLHPVLNIGFREVIGKGRMTVSYKAKAPETVDVSPEPSERDA